MKTLDEILLPYQKDFVRSKKKRKLWLSGRQVGKSFTLAYLAVQNVLTSKRGPTALALCISTGARASSEFLKKCVQMAEAVSILEPSVTFTSSADCIKFFNGARIVSLPSGNPAGLRGWTASLVVIDEAAYIENPAHVWQAIAPTLTRDPDAELVLASTPAGKASWFYEMYEDAVDDKDWLVQTTSIEDAAARGLKVNLEELKKTVGDPDVWDMEYMCKFASEFGSMLDVKLLQFAAQPDGEQRACFMGMDVAAQHDRTAIADVVQLEDGSFFVRDIVMMHKADYQHQLEVLKELHQQKHWNSGYVDATGLGSPIGEFANKQVSASIRGYTFTAPSKLAAYENFRALVFDRKLKFAEHLKKLVEEDVQNVARVVSESGSIKYVAGHNGNGHSDSISALVLALMAAKEMPASMSAPVPYARRSSFGAWSSRLV